MAEITGFPGRNNKVPTAVDTVRRDDAIAQVRALEKQIVGSEGEACRLRMAQGDVLIPIRDSVGHGRWLPFLADCRLSVRNAQIAMQLAEKREEIEAANAKSSSHLSIAAALKLIRPPKSPKSPKSPKPPKPAGVAPPVGDGPDHGEGRDRGSEDLFWDDLRAAADDDLLAIMMVDELSRNKAELVAREILRDIGKDPYSPETLIKLSAPDRAQILAALGITHADVPSNIVAEIAQHAVSQERKQAGQFTKKVRSALLTNAAPARKVENIRTALEALDAGGASDWCARMDRVASGFTQTKLEASSALTALDPAHSPTKH